MKFRFVAALGLVCGLALGSPAAYAEDTAATPSLSNKWRIEVSGGANSDGHLLFRLTPDQGTPVDVKVEIDDGRGENAVAGDIKRAMKKALDRKTYAVEVDDGEDVLVKKKKGPDFAIVLVESTVRNTKVRFDKE
jgi:hypothetical protein